MGRAETDDRAEGRPVAPWLEIALRSPKWSSERIAHARSLVAECEHLGQVAEHLRCSVFEVQAELGIGPRRAVRSYRRIRGMDGQAGA